MIKGQADHKVLCVMPDDEVYGLYTGFEQLPGYDQKEIRWFFEQYQRMMHRDVEVSQIEGPDSAQSIIHGCMEAYDRTFGQSKA